MKFENNMVVTLPNGVRVINTTPHSVRFGLSDGSTVEVEPCGILVNATPREKVVRQIGGTTLVKTEFDADPNTMLALSEFDDNVLFIGSLIAAQAYPYVVALVACEGFERVPPDQKRMRVDKFTTFY